MSYLEKTWGIKCKTCKITPPKRISGQIQLRPTETVKFVLEFTKNVENLKELREAFSLKPPSPLFWHLFDEDNVTVLKAQMPFNVIEGELSGKKGEGFRMTVGIPEAIFKKTRKIELRPGEKEKDKDKAKK